MAIRKSTRSKQTTKRTMPTSIVLSQQDSDQLKIWIDKMLNLKPKSLEQTDIELVDETISSRKAYIHISTTTRGKLTHLHCSKYKCRSTNILKIIEQMENTPEYIEFKRSDNMFEQVTNWLKTKQVMTHAKTHAAAKNWWFAITEEKRNECIAKRKSLAGLEPDVYDLSMTFRFDPDVNFLLSKVEAIVEDYSSSIFSSYCRKTKSQASLIDLGDGKYLQEVEFEHGSYEYAIRVSKYSDDNFAILEYLNADELKNRKFKVISYRAALNKFIEFAVQFDNDHEDDGNIIEILEGETIYK